MTSDQIIIICQAWFGADTPEEMRAILKRWGEYDF